MKSAIYTLEERLSSAIQEATGQRGLPALVRPATDPKFGDYQANGIMALAKKLKANPRKLAEEVLKKLDVGDICAEPEIAGPGFINLRLKTEFLAKRLREIHKDPQKRLGIEKAQRPLTIVVDFSGPNIAKQMHVGHLRSTIIGDCICRMLEFLGHKVIRQNHIGDWGLQIGMIVYAIKKEVFKAQEYNPATDRLLGGDLNSIADLNILEELYKKVSALIEYDPNAAEAVRKTTVELQRGCPFEVEYWNHARTVTLKACFEIYDLLGGVFKPEDICGESFYKDKLADVVNDLKKAGIAEPSEGAVCVFSLGFKDKDGKDLPLIVQKSDGAFLYATTDLAAIRYRVRKLKAERIIYVTDARQSLHFEMVFAVARLAGWAKPETELLHVTFGSVLGENGKPLKTRAGESVKLEDLLDEAVERAKAIVEEKNPDLPVKKKEHIAQAVGIGAVKYADYSNNRTTDYIFSFDKMLAMDGNTAPYMQYAYARIKSIERKAKHRDVDIETELGSLKEVNLTEPAEIDLAKHLIRYGEAIFSAAEDYRPNYLTTYLFDLAQKFSSFYNSCPVLGADQSQRPSRLLLCDLTAETIKHGLHELLGIEVVEQM